MLNPSARPWYPVGDAVPSAQVLPLRWNNDSYNPSTVQQPPIPLCGDSDLSSIQLNTLGDAESPTPVIPAPSGEGPYRSTMLLKEDVPSMFESRRQRQHWKANNWLLDVTPLRYSSGALSSLESMGDSQDVYPLHGEETYSGPVARTVPPKVLIPLPRSRRQTVQHSNPSCTAKTITADTCVAATMTVPTACTTTTTNNNNNNNNNTEDEINTNHATDIASCASDAHDKKNAQCPDSGVSCETKGWGTTRQLSTFSLSGALTATKKPKLKAKREEKWTIVQGKVGIDVAAPTSLTAPKKSTSSAAVVKVREDGTVICLTDLQPVERTRAKQHQIKEKEDEESVKDGAVVRAKTKRLRDARRTKDVSTDDELLESFINGTMSLSPTVSGNNNNNNNNSVGAAAEGSAPVVIMGVPLAGISQADQLLPSPQVATRYKTAFRIFLRCMTMTEASNVKTVLLHRALRGLPESSYHQCPELVCAILLETSDSCADVEKSLQTCYKALQLAEKHKLDLFDMLARLAITRTFARVIDTMDARVNLTRAATIAIAKNEKAALGWIAMQMGVTLEISGMFPESLAWYEVAQRLAQDTEQPQLLCDIYCCQSIAFSAIGELERAHQAYESSRALLPLIPRHRHQRPLQNYAQLKCQLGDMVAALRLQETELEITRDLGDMQAASRCMGAIALTKRFLCRYEEAAENHMEELSVYNAQDPRQIIESLTGAAACWRLGGHLEKAYDYCMRALRQAQQCQDLTTLAKALVELAEAELSLNILDKAEQHLRESLATVARVDEAEQKQYLVKAALCEVEWRCCSILEQVHFRRGEVFEALQWSDRCHVPNTAQVDRLLLRRQRRAAVSLDLKDVELVSKGALTELLRRPGMRGWRIVCYSLPWNEGMDFMAYVLALDENENLICVGRPLRMQEELIALVCAPNALSEVLDAPMYTEDGVRIYGDTPLWPQLYSKVAFDFQQSPENAERLKSLRTDVHYCLQLLYNSFIQPLEADIDDVAGLIFVSDGVFSRLPFHAFYDGKRYLTERYCTSTCCSMALLCTHFAEESVKGTDEKRMRCFTAVDDAAHRTVLLDEYLAKAAEEGVLVRCTVIDEDLAGMSAGEARNKSFCENDQKDHNAQAEGDEAEETLSDDANVAAMQRLLHSLYRRGKVKSVRNALYRAVHEEVVAGGVLELRLRAVPEVREDYCGSFVGASSNVIASQSSEVANTWDLRRYTLVMCTGVGTYSGLSIHETGIPVYRSLQYAGARRMLLATGSRIPTNNRVVVAAATAAMTAVTGGCNVAAAVRDAYLQCIADNTPLAEWAGFSLVGLP